LDYVEDIFLAGRLLLPSLKLFHFYTICIISIKTGYTGLGGANPAVNTPRPSRGTRIESCDFIVLIGDP
ncbi:unnamed protein product, partial [Ascophyllum nodosum]